MLATPEMIQFIIYIEAMPGPKAQQGGSPKLHSGLRNPDQLPDMHRPRCHRFSHRPFCKNAE